VILLVEDDDLVRASSVGMLRDLGYTCVHASDGTAALERLRDGVKVDLLFTDVVMPGPCAAAIWRARPSACGRTADPVHVRLHRGRHRP